MRQWRGGGRQEDPASHACATQPREPLRRTKPKNNASMRNLQKRAGLVFDVTAPATQVALVRLAVSSSTAPDFQCGRIPVEVCNRRQHTMRCAELRNPHALQYCCHLLLPPAVARAPAALLLCPCALLAGLGLQILNYNMMFPGFSGRRGLVERRQNRW